MCRSVHVGRRRRSKKKIAFVKRREVKYIKSQIIVNLSKTFYCALLFKLAGLGKCMQCMNELCLREREKKQTGKCELSGKVINLLLYADGIA